MADEVPAGMDQYVAQSPPHQTGGASAAVPPGMEQYVSEEANQREHGSLPQQLLAGYEGAMRGASLGLSDIAEQKLLGQTKESIRARAEANPVTSTIGSGIGGAALIYGTGGLAAPEAGLAETLIGHAAEGGIFGLGNSISDAALGNGNLNAQKVASDIGMGALIGVGAGALGYGLKGAFNKFGIMKGTAAETITDEAEKAKSSAATANAIDDIGNDALKISTPEVEAAAKEIGAPIHKGMISNDPWIQKATDSLVQGDPTFAAKSVANTYAKGFDRAAGAVESTLDSGAGQLTRNELGSTIQENLSAQIVDEGKPFKDLYGAIKEDSKDIPLKSGSSDATSKSIQDIPEVKRSFNSPAAKLANDVAEEIKTLTNVDDLRAYQSELKGRISPTSPPQEKRILALVSEKLDSWERKTITDFADSASRIDEGIAQTNLRDMAPEEYQRWTQKVQNLKTLLSRIDEADAQYKPFRQKLNELSEWLGKGKLYGPKDAIDFIQNRLEPEDLAKKLTDKKYLGLYEFMDKNFPREAALVRQYQKNELKEFASRTGNFSPLNFFNKLKRDYSPEIQKFIFSPDELKKINAAETYLRAFPKNFNPSGTSHMAAFRQFFSNPVSAATANLRDGAIMAYIELMGKMPEGLKPNPVQFGLELGKKTLKYNAVQNIMNRTNKVIKNGAKSVFTGGSSGIIYHKTHNFDDVKKRLDEFSMNDDVLPQHLQNHVQGIAEELPNISQGLQSNISASIQFLKTKMPQDPNPMPLSREWEPSQIQKNKFMTYYNYVNNPLSVLDDLKRGSVSSQSLEALSQTHPDLLDEMRKEVVANMDQVKAVKLPYRVKQSLSLFLGQPLDSSMLPQVIVANQQTFQAPQPSQVGQSTKKSTQSGLAKLSGNKRLATNTQDVEEES